MHFIHAVMQLVQKKVPDCVWYQFSTEFTLQNELGTKITFHYLSVCLEAICRKEYSDFISL